jgi:ABC-2 type transport system ATP-binding protein
MRMLVGLSRPTSGTSRILGKSYVDISNPGRHVGVLLDASAQHAGRTGREVLTLSAVLMGMPGRRVDEMLELVGLDAAEAKKRVGTYSLGMRQRLGIAHAFLGDPKVLILDEPANGLDPSGIRWMRMLLRGFAETGGTVLLSSHLLHEVELVADELLVIGRGRIVARGSTQSLVASSGISVRSRDPRALADALTRGGIEFTEHADGWFTTPCTAEEVGQAAAASSVALTELRTADTTTLEDLYLQLTDADAREHATPQGDIA